MAGRRRRGSPVEAYLRVAVHLLLLRLYESTVDCDFGFDSRITKAGNFTSPRYPSEYPSGVTCRYAFRGDRFEGLRISFHSFELEEPYKGGCLADYVDITTVDNSERNERHLVGRFCGSTPPSPVLTMQPTAELVFRTNWAVQKRGFHAAYQFLHEKDTPAPTSSPDGTNCGGVIEGGRSLGGVLTSPDYPRSVPDNVDCIWLIRVESPSRVHVKLEELQFHGSLASCERMELSFYDGYTGFSKSALKLQSLCGNLQYYRDVNDRIVLSARNRLLVRFQATDGIRPQDAPGHGTVGFKLVWTAVTFSDIDACRGFVCRRSNYCLRSSPTSSCTSALAFCIGSELVCDGVSNCSENDDSDEDNCYMPYLLSLVCAVVPTLLIVSVATCVIVRRRRRERFKKSCSQMQSLTMQLRQLDHSPSSSSNRQHPSSLSPSYSQPCDLLTPTFAPEMRNGLPGGASVVATSQMPYDAYGGSTLLTDDIDCSRYKGFPTQV